MVSNISPSAFSYRQNGGWFQQLQRFILDYLKFLCHNSTRNLTVVMNKVVLLVQINWRCFLRQSLFFDERHNVVSE